MCPPLVEIGLTYPPKSGRAAAPPASHLAACLLVSVLRAVGTGWPKQHISPHIATLLIPSQPGGQIVSTTLLLCPPGFLDLPTALDSTYIMISFGTLNKKLKQWNHTFFGTHKDFIHKGSCGLTLNASNATKGSMLFMKLHFEYLLIEVQGTRFLVYF